MKRKPCQVPFKLSWSVRAVSACLAMAASLIINMPPANAQSGGLCTTACPKCCSNPDTLLKQQFRGPVPLNGLPRKSLDEWYTSTFWDKIENKITAVTNQILMGINEQTTRRGTFMDAQNNIRAIGSLQKGTAKTSSRYLGSEAMCRYATLSQGLSASEGVSGAVKLSILKRSLDRQFMTTGSPSATNTVGEKAGEEGETMGESADKETRWQQYVDTFCDPSDNSQGSVPSGVCGSSNDAQYNKDINFAETLGQPMTLNINGSSSSKDMQNLTALSDNLYAHNLANNVQVPPENASDSDVRKYMLLRSVIAKRAVAENTFTSIAAMKAAGTSASAKFTEKLMIELGISKAEAKEFVGANPSYYAQMEALTRKMYESPAFYANLMEGPMNVKRQQAAMKSLELMQQRDIYKSLQRTEMLMATLLDIYVSREQGGVDKRRVQGAN